MRWIALVLALALGAYGQEGPRGSEFLGRVDTSALDDGRLRQEIVTPTTVRKGEKPLKANERRVIVHPVPVWHVGDDGALAPVSTTIEAARESLKDTWRADANTVKFRVNEDGLASYRAGGHVLRVRPARARAEATGGGTVTDAVQAKPTLTTAEGSRVVQVGQFADVRFEHIVEPGRVKEIAWIDKRPEGLETARNWLLLWQYQSETLTPVIQGGEVLWQAGGETILRWPVPYVEDGAGRELQGQYRLRAAQGLVGVALLSSELLTATYPVALDPTTTTGLSDVTASRSIRSPTIGGTPDRDVESWYALTTLPDMTGNTVTAAEWQVYATGYVGPLTVNWYAAKHTTSWNGSSNITTMNAVRTEVGSSVGTSSSWTSGAWHYLDVLGDGTKGVSKIYADNPNPGACTFSLRWTDFYRTRDSVTTFPSIGSIYDGTYLDLSGITDASWYPRVVITYSSGDTNQGSFFSFF